MEIKLGQKSFFESWVSVEKRFYEFFEIFVNF